MTAANRGLSTRARIAAIAGAVSFLVLAGSGIASASWTAVGVASGSVTAAVASATFAYDGPSTLDGVTYALTGSTSTARFAITNTGSTPLTYSATLSPSGTGSTLLASLVSINLWSAPTCTTVPLSGWQPFTVTGLTMPAGATGGAPASIVPLCVATRFTGVAPLLSTTSLKSVLSVTGTVGNWTTGAQSVTFTQSAHQIPAATGLVCTATAATAGLFFNTEGYVKLSWIAPAGVTGVTYTLADASDPAGTTPRIVTSGVKISYADLNGSPANLILYTISNGETSVGIQITLLRGQVMVSFWPFVYSSVNTVTCL